MAAPSFASLQQSVLGVSFDDSVAADDGIVPEAGGGRGGPGHLALIQQTEQVAAAEAKNFIVQCACCKKGSDEAFVFINLVEHVTACIFGM